MNQRLHRLCNASSPKREDGFLRYLRPGALAQIRNSRISARSQTPSSQNLIFSSSAATTSQTEMAMMMMMNTESFPCFELMIGGPKYPQRKKLFASKSAAMAVAMFSSLSSAGQVSDSSSDLVLAH
ncbi:hypothetical protein Syun_026965 [Stephania yunnanensis]|uniref:Uncharacterized protein n=1 Tax=Stephania yunnanensis TaxID=152371 RepID=A0AAP0HMA9_9MAGN